MEATAILGFAGVALALISVPGPDWAFILASARDRSVFPAVVGLMAGYGIITAVVVAGLGALVATAPLALTALTVAGSAYLMYLGIRTLTSTTVRKHAGSRTVLADAETDPGTGPEKNDPGVPVPSDRADRPSSTARQLRQGILVSGLNPKGLLIFVAILPQFADPQMNWPMTIQLAILGLVYVVLTGAFYLPLGLAATRVLSSRPGMARLTTRIAGAAMVIVGLVLLIERLAQQG